MSDRPPYYPSYPAYPGVPPTGPPYPGNEWRPPPPYNPGMPPTGFPMPPTSSMYPDLRPGGFENKGQFCSCSQSYPSYPGPPQGTCRPNCGRYQWRPAMTSRLPKNEWYSSPSFKDFWSPPSHCVGTVSWVPSSGGSVPDDAVHAGQDRDGGPIFVGRAYHEGDLLPAKVCPSHGTAFVSYAGTEVPKLHYEVLCSGHVAWKYARLDEIPTEAIRVGTTADGEPLFVGRTMLEGTMTPGKVHPSHKVLYVPFNGKELSFPEYEILILN